LLKALNLERALYFNLLLVDYYVLKTSQVQYHFFFINLSKLILVCWTSF